MARTKLFAPKHTVAMQRRLKRVNHQLPAPLGPSAIATPAMDAMSERVDGVEGQSARTNRMFYVSGKWKTQFTADKKEVFLREYAKCGNQAKAADKAGISTGTVGSHKSPKSPTYDPLFAEAFNEARLLYHATIEAEIHRRAIEGVDEPIIGGKDRDEIVATVKKYSDGLLTTMAKRHMRDDYGDKLKVEQKTSVASSGTQLAPGIDLADMTPHQRKKLKEFLTAMDGVDRSEVIDAEFEEDED